MRVIRRELQKQSGNRWQTMAKSVLLVVILNQFLFVVGNLETMAKLVAWFG